MHATVYILGMYTLHNPPTLKGSAATWKWRLYKRRDWEPVNLAATKEAWWVRFPSHALADYNHCVGSDNVSLGVSCYLEGVLASSPGTQKELVYTAPNEAQSLTRSSDIRLDSWYSFEKTKYNFYLALHHKYQNGTDIAICGGIHHYSIGFVFVA